MPADTALRKHVVYLLQGGGAHIDFDAAVNRLPARLHGARPEGLPLTPWRLLEHMRLAQRDILSYSRSAEHVSPPWPEGYWPEADAPPDPAAWQRSVRAFRGDLRAMIALVRKPTADLLAPIPWGEDDHTLLREALLIADHNAYHLGQFVTLRRLLNAWPG